MAQNISSSGAEQQPKNAKKKEVKKKKKTNQNPKKKKEVSTKQKVKRSLRPQTQKAAQREDPNILEANWPIVDFLIITQLIFAFIFLFNAIIIAALGVDGSWSAALFALQLFITAIPSFVLIAKGEVEPAIVVYSILQLLSAFFGYFMVLRFFIRDSSTSDSDDNQTSVYSHHVVLWIIIVWQLSTTICINWIPYRRVDLSKLRRNLDCDHGIEAVEAREAAPTAVNTNGGGMDTSGASGASVITSSRG